MAFDKNYFNPKELDELDITLLQLQSLVPETQRYIEEHFKELVEQNVIFEVKAIAQAINVPPGFVEGITYKIIGPSTFILMNTWGNEEEPLALWFNDGTRDHGPVRALRLHWKDKVTGKDIYAKWVRGVPKTNAMERGLAVGMRRFISAVISKSKSQVRSRLGIDE